MPAVQFSGYRESGNKAKMIAADSPFTQVQQKEPDVSEMMMRAQNMGRQAEFGEGSTTALLVDSISVG